MHSAHHNASGEANDSEEFGVSDHNISKVQTIITISKVKVGNSGKEVGNQASEDRSGL